MISILLLVGLGVAKDKSNSYQEGIYFKSVTIETGTYTSTLQATGGAIPHDRMYGATISGDITPDTSTTYYMDTPTGRWGFQVAADQAHGLVGTTMACDPLLFLKTGSKLLFRTKDYQRLNGKDHAIFIPCPETPDKEVKYYGTFYW
jgi:hypothetical protein